MKTHRQKRFTPATWLVATAIAFAAAPSGVAAQKYGKNQANADKASATAAHDPQKISIAPNDLDDRTAEHYTGKDVRGSRGNYIGNLADVIVDSKKGMIVFYVVSSGGLAGIGDTLRLVPYHAMTPVLP
jgi:sporulation protein YlmC with PRC-barrel domain